MSLKEELSGIRGNKRKFLLLRIADVSTPLARNLCGVSVHSYNQWVSHAGNRFVEVYRRRNELAAEYQHEAILMLRKENQLAAVLLESEIIKKLATELETGEYTLLRTNLAREVYSKLISDLNTAPASQVHSWEQRSQQIVQILSGDVQPRIGVIEDAEPQEISSQQEEHQEGNLLTTGE